MFDVLTSCVLRSTFMLLTRQPMRSLKHAAVLSVECDVTHEGAARCQSMALSNWTRRVSRRTGSAQGLQISSQYCTLAGSRQHNAHPLRSYLPTAILSALTTIARRHSFIHSFRLLPLVLFSVSAYASCLLFGSCCELLIGVIICVNKIKYV